MKSKRSRNRRRREARDRAASTATLPSTVPNYGVRCSNGDAVPTVGNMALCGPCVFGEADTAGGNW